LNQLRPFFSLDAVVTPHSLFFEALRKFRRAVLAKPNQPAS
jgi:hypothetical protein